MSVESYSLLELEFQSLRTGASLPLRFQIESFDLAQRWARKLAVHLQLGCHLEKGFLLHGWLGGPRDEAYLCNELNRHIEIVNRAYETKPGGLEYHIDETFNFEKIDQDQLNAIHHHFEILIGQVWNPSPLYKDWIGDAIYSIRQLNHLCHELEDLIGSRLSHKRGGCAAYLIASMLPPRLAAQGFRDELRLSDYDNFDLRLNFGDVYLHYAQLGKTHFEAFLHNDNKIERSNISGLRYLTGEFDICFADDPQLQSFDSLKQDFLSWLIKNGFDPSDRTLGLGQVRVARLDKSIFGHKSDFEILNELFNYDDVKRISVIGPNVSQSRNFFGVGTLAAKEATAGYFLGAP